ncbi:MAG: sulfite exporter TauE/SafE family protein [Bdellovibrionales bacterium]|nr:sulfite exporter TauE/SafE family protein [Bdellovibrionales bacterium]
MGLSEGSLLLSTLGVALLGGGHCFGMCGGIAAMAGISRAPAYHAGRLIGYAAIGAVAGAFGKAMFAFLGNHPGWQLAVFFVFLGALGFQFWRVWTGALSAGARWGIPLAKLRSKFARSGGAFGYGLATAFVPCGWFAYFGWIAAATGSPVLGSLVFVSLWAGALPALLAAAVAFHSLRARFPGAAFRRTAAFVLLVTTLVTLGPRIDGFAATAAARGAAPVCGPHP